MTLQNTNGQADEATRRRSRGPGKPFPSITFEEALFLPKQISELGIDGEIQRLTLLKELDISPNSSKTRGLISGSLKYGLTEGSYGAPSLSITDQGRAFLDTDSSSNEFKQKGFELAINRFDPFKGVYERLKDNRLREGPVLNDEFQRFGISEGDCSQAAKIFTANLTFLDLVEQISGNDYVRSFDQATSEAETDDDVGSSKFPVDSRTTQSSSTAERAERNEQITSPTNEPELHINVQIHIDPTSSPELIDRIFSSMAKHLYGRAR